MLALILLLILVAVWIRWISVSSADLRRAEQEIRREIRMRREGTWKR